MRLEMEQRNCVPFPHKTEQTDSLPCDPFKDSGHFGFTPRRKRILVSIHRRPKNDWKKVKETM